MSDQTSAFKRSYYIPQQAEKTHEIPDDMLGTEPRRVLLLEDDPELSGMLSEALSSLSLATTTVTNGTEGLKQIMASDYDLIVCDMVMPGLPGDMFYLAVERTRPHLCKRFVFMTGHRSEKKWDEFARSKGCVILWKPFELPVFLEVAQAVLRKTRQAG